MRCEANNGSGKRCRMKAGPDHRCHWHSDSSPSTQRSYKGSPSNGTGKLHCHLCGEPCRDHSLTGGCPAHQTTLGLLDRRESLLLPSEAG